MDSDIIPPVPPSGFEEGQNAEEKESSKKRSLDQDAFDDFIKDSSASSEKAPLPPKETLTEKEVSSAEEVANNPNPGDGQDAGSEAEPVHKVQKEVEEHFNKLKKKHEETIKELTKVVSKPKEKTRPEFLKRFVKENGQLATSLKELSEALDIMDDRTYEDVLSKDKSGFKSWVKQLVEKNRSKNLDPEKLQEQLVNAIAKYSKEIEEQMESKKKELDVQARLIVQEEDSLDSKKKELEKEKQLLETQNKHLEKERQLLTKERQLFEEDKRSLAKQKLSLEQREQKIAQKEEYLKKQEVELPAHFKKLKEGADRVLDKLHQEQKEFSEMKLEAETDINNKADAVMERERNIGVKEQALIDKYHEREKQLDEREESLALREKEFKEKMRKGEEELKEKYREREENLRSREEKVESSLKQIEELDRRIREKVNQVENLKEEVDNEGFKNYIHEKLKEISPGHNVPVAEKSEVLEIKYKDLFDKIKSCNDAIESRSFDEARKIYNELKNSFDSKDLEADERDILYDAIRELYANLHLALLSR